MGWMTFTITLLLLCFGFVPHDASFRLILNPYTLPSHSGHFWVRLSGSVYNTREDYLRLKEVLIIKLKEWTKTN